MAIDVDTGLDDFFKSQGSSDAQRADAIAVLKEKCGFVGGVVVLLATGEAIDTDKSREWIEANKPHLLPAKFETSLADQAFIGAGNKTAAANLIKQVGMVEATKIAESYGKRTPWDTRPGKAPARDDEPTKKNGNGHDKDRATNPFSREGWNVSKHGALLRAIGVEKCAAIARSVGARLGDVRPNPNF